MSKRRRTAERGGLLDCDQFGGSSIQLETAAAAESKYRRQLRPATGAARSAAMKPATRKDAGPEMFSEPFIRASIAEFITAKRDSCPFAR
jgi:hypothetical protein